MPILPIPSLRKKTIWRLHSILGLLAAIPLLILSLTGSVLVFKAEIDRVWDPALNHRTPAQDTRIPFDTLYQSLRPQLPDHILAGWIIHPDPTVTDTIWLMDKADHEHWQLARVDAYTGELLTPPQDRTQASFTEWSLQLHEDLTADHLGALIVGLTGVLLTLLGLTGFFLYRNFYKTFFTMRWRTSLRLLSGNLHKRIGVLSAPLFFLLGITGAYWNLGHLIEHLGEDHHHHDHHEEVIPPVTASIDQILADTKERLPGYTPIYLSLPFAPDGHLTVWGYEKDRPFTRSRFSTYHSYHRDTGAHQLTQRASEAPAWSQIEDSFRPLHYGNYGGLPVKILYCVLGLAPAFLALSGSYIALKRLRRN